jgi:hypothetical protein
LALYIFEEQYHDNIDEWRILASKAKDYLINRGILKPETMLRNMRVYLRNDFVKAYK